MTINIIKKKTTNRNTNKKRNTKKYYKHGGVKISYDYPTAEDAFKYFLTHSTIELLSDSSKYGIIYKLSLKPDVTESPYYSLRSNHLGNKLDIIIIKIIVSSEFKQFWLYKRENKHITRSDAFTHEVNIQLNIYDQSKEEFEPICPSIVFADLLKPTDELRNIFVSYLSEPDNISNSITQISINSLLTISKKPEYNFGVVAMELMSDAKTVSKSVNELQQLNNLSDIAQAQLALSPDSYDGTNYNSSNPSNNPSNNSSNTSSSNSSINSADNQRNIDNILVLTLYEHYRLFKLGYLHGDFHCGNAMFFPTDVYIENFHGRVMLIDFGAAFEHNMQIPDDLTFRDLITIMLDTDTPIIKTNILPRDWPSYQWVIYYENDTLFSEVSQYRENITNLFFERLENSGFQLSPGLIYNDTLSGGNIEVINKIDNNKMLFQPNIVQKQMEPIQMKEKTEKMNLKLFMNTPTQQQKDAAFNFTEATKMFQKEKTTLKQAVEDETKIHKEIMDTFNK